MTEKEAVHSTIIDLDQIEYDSHVLLFLRKKLDDFTINLFRKIFQENKKNPLGLMKTHIEDYHSMRKKYDNAFLILESQGFIERHELGTATPYHITVRGKQLVILLANEKGNN